MRRRGGAAQRVEGLYGASKLGVSFGCRWFSGDVVAERPDGSFDLQYDDGELEERVLPMYMRLLGAASPPAPPAAASGEDEDEPPWIVSLRARAAASSERRVRTLRQLAASIQPLEDSLSTLGLSVRLVDEKSGLPITPDAFVFVGVLAAVQLYILGLLLAPLVS